jgi:hypothetical protein
MPIVAWYVASNLSYMKREMTDVFPTDWSCARIYACACVCVDHKNISKSALSFSLSPSSKEREGKREKRFENEEQKRLSRKEHTTLRSKKTHPEKDQLVLWQRSLTTITTSSSSSARRRRCHEGVVSLRVCCDSLSKEFFFYCVLTMKMMSLF